MKPEEGEQVLTGEADYSWGLTRLNQIWGVMPTTKGPPLPADFYHWIVQQALSLPGV